MTRRNTMLLVAVAAVAAVGAYWMLVLTPKREEAAALDKQIAAKQAALAQAEAEVATYEQARGAYKANYSMVARLGKAVPADDDVRSLLVQLNSAADAQRCRLPHDQHRRRRAPRPPVPAPPARPPATTPPPGASTRRHRRLLDDAVHVRLQGQLLRAGQVLRPPRPLRRGQARAASTSPAGCCCSTASRSIPDAEKGFPALSADVGANSYLLPRHRGPDRRRDPRGSDRPAAAAGAPAPGEPTAPATTTTATISGATR